MNDAKPLHDHAIEGGAGDVVVRCSDGTETHIFFAQHLGDGQDSTEPLQVVNEVAEAQLGPVRADVEGGGTVTRPDAWPVTLDWKRREASDYFIEHRLQEFYVGAAGVSEQIVLAVYAGVASGVAAAITSEIIHRLRRLGTPQRAGDGPTDRDPTTLVQSYLHKHCGAAGELVVQARDQSDKYTELVLTDDRGVEFRVRVEDDGAVVAITKP
jgi:hypothetical protein